MTKISKTLHTFLNHPETLRYTEIKKILLFLGCEEIPAKGSHVKFKYPGAFTDLIIPVHHNDCKQFYKKLALAFVKNLPTLYEKASQTLSYYSE